MKNNNLAMMAMMTAVMNLQSEVREENKFIATNKDIRKVTPNGCKEYYFIFSGMFDVEYKTKGVEYVFSCFALNEYNARKKFDKWKANERNK